MIYTVTTSCGHTADVQIYGTAAERERKVAWYGRSYICEDCRNADKAAGCDEVTMSYAAYKRDYAECRTKSGSYDARAKTIIVYVPREPVPTAPCADTQAADTIRRTADQSAAALTANRTEANADLVDSLLSVIPIVAARLIELSHTWDYHDTDLAGHIALVKYQEFGADEKKNAVATSIFNIVHQAGE